MAGGKLRDIRHTIGYGATDGVETLKGCLRGDMRLDIVDDPVKLVERLRGLAVKIDIVGEVEFLHLVETLDDNGGAVGLAHQSEDFGMTFLPENHDLRRGFRLHPCPLFPGGGEL